ncbi:MAG: uroporphyrinogen-III synthase [Burkholderiaceae bacterium]|jgi:uroporphyrinogen-III synthase|nr:uroporphyrinogen-III synthase [Burkholderiaceae bacterium]
MNAPRVIVTRPSPEAERWARALAAQGVPAQALPLIEIGSPPDPAALRAAVLGLNRWQAVMFVSGNAVAGFMECFLALVQAHYVLKATKSRAWAPGAGTARALREAGWPQELIDQPAPDATQFDSESLWAQVAPQVQPGTRVLVVRGAGEDGQGRGRDWLAGQIQAAGGSVDYVQAYRRAAPAPTAAALALARGALQDGSVWLLSSSQAVAHLRGWLPTEDFSRAHALATHPRIAQAARAAGFGRVDSCRPLLADVARVVQGLNVGAVPVGAKDFSPCGA